MAKSLHRLCVGFVWICFVLTFLALGTEAYSKKSTQESYYKLLSVSNKASSKDIREAYRKIAKTDHPDKLDDPTQEQKDRWMFITEAYETLMNPLKRREYDESMKEKLRSTPGGWNSKDYSAWGSDSYDDDGFDTEEEEFDGGDSGLFDDAQWKAHQEADRQKQHSEPVTQRYKAYEAANSNRRKAEKSQQGFFGWLKQSFHFEVDDDDEFWEDGQSTSSRWSQGQKSGPSFASERDSQKSPDSKLRGGPDRFSYLNQGEPEDREQSGVWSWLKSKTRNTLSSMNMNSLVGIFDDADGGNSRAESGRTPGGKSPRDCRLVTEMTDEGIRTFRKCD